MCHRRSVLKLSSFAIFLALAPVAPAAAAEFTAHGRLLGPGGVPVAGATVSASRMPENGGEAFARRFGELELPELGRIRSGGDGVFNLALPSEGFYRFEVRAEGFLTFEQTQLVPSSEPALLLLPPLRRARRVRVAVEEANGKKLAGARVRAEESGQSWDVGNWQAFATTGEDGSAELAVPAGAGVTLYAAAPGLAGGELRLEDGAERATLRLEAGAPLPALVTDERRRPLPGVRLFLADGRLPLAITGKDGRAILRVLPEQKRFGLADAAGREGLEVLRPAPDDPRAAPQLVAMLAEPRPVRGQVVERATRQPVEGAWVFIFGGDGGGDGATAGRSDRAGYFELARPQGPAQTLLGAFRAGFRQGAAALGDGTGEVVVELDPALRIEGRVTDAAGRRVGGATVLATTESLPFEFSFPSFTISRRDGGFAMADLAPGAVVQAKAVVGRLSSPVVKAELKAGEPAILELVLASPARLACRVLDPRGKPVAGAEVFGANLSDPRSPLLDVFETPVSEDDRVLLGSTDAEGYLRLGDLTPGSWDLAARAAPWAPALMRQVALGAGSEKEGEKLVELRLRAAGEAKGKVVDEAGEGVAGAALFLTPVPDDPNHETLRSGGTPSATSGAGGEFAITGVDGERRFHLVATKDGYAKGVLWNAATGAEPLMLALQRGARVEGTITAAGRPGVFPINLVEEGQGPFRGGREGLLEPHMARPDAAGAFVFDQVRPGRYRLQLPPQRGYQLFTGETFELRAGETRVEEIELQKAALLKGTIYQANGEPARAGVSLVGRGNPDRSPPIYSTDEAGRFRIETAIPGPAELKVSGSGFREKVQEIEIVPGENEIELTLEAGPIELEAKVVDGEGAPVDGAEVFLSGRYQYQATSEAGGRVRLGGLESGKYLLSIQKEGYLQEAKELLVEESRQGLEWRVERAAAKIKGRILGLPETACTDLAIRVVRGQAMPAFGRCENGSYQVEGIPTGKLTLIAGSPSAGRVLTRSLDVAAGEAETLFDLDFRILAGPWSGKLRLGEQNLRNVKWWLEGKNGILMSGFSADGNIELYADQGRYRLRVKARPMEETKTIEIEIGNPTEQLIDASEP